MSTETTSWLERLWRRVESRYETETVSCDCSEPDDAARALDRSRLTRDDLAAYQRDEVSMAELTAKADADLDPSAIDDIETLAVELQQALDIDSRARE